MYGLFAQIFLEYNTSTGLKFAQFIRNTFFVIHRFMWEPGLQFQNFSACKNPR